MEKNKSVQLWAPFKTAKTVQDPFLSTCLICFNFSFLHFQKILLTDWHWMTKTWHLVKMSVFNYLSPQELLTGVPTSTLAIHLQKYSTLLTTALKTSFRSLKVNAYLIHQHRLLISSFLLILRFKFEEDLSAVNSEQVEIWVMADKKEETHGFPEAADCRLAGSPGTLIWGWGDS